MRRLIAVLPLLIATAGSPLAAQSFATGLSGVGTQDLGWSVSWASGPYRATAGTGSATAPWVVNDVNGVWQPDAGIGGTNWISYWPTASAPDGVGDYNEATGTGDRYTYTYTYDFVATSAGQLDFSAGWDNIFAAFVLNGVSYTPSGILTSATDNSVDDHFGFCRSGDGILDGGYPSCTADFAVNGVVAGSNSIEVILKGDGETDGLWMNGSVVPVGLPESTTPEPAAMTMIATGLIGMGASSLRRRRKTAA